MPVGSYMMGLGTLAAGVMVLFNPQLPEHPTSPASWWTAFSGWVVHQPPPYATVNMFGVTPDIVLRPRHGFVRGAGFHRKYRLSVDVLPGERVDVGTCRVVAEWAMPRDVIVDQWLLHRASPVQWEVGTGAAVCDLEAPVYSDAALPFKLRARAPIRGGTVSVDIPDVLARYQQPSSLRTRSPKFFLHPPRVTAECTGEREYVVRVVEDAQYFRPLDMCVPVARPSELVNRSTYAFVMLALLYILYQLYKA